MGPQFTQQQPAAAASSCCPISEAAQAFLEDERVQTWLVAFVLLTFAYGATVLFNWLVSSLVHGVLVPMYRLVVRPTGKGNDGGAVSHGGRTGDLSVRACAESID